MTAATYVGSASGGAAATTLTCAAPSGVVSGDHQLAIVCLEITGEAITAVPSGWTLIARVDNSLDSGDSMATALYRSTTATGSSSWTKNGARSGWVVRLAWRGGNGLNTGTAVSATRAASTSVALPTCTTTAVDSLVLGFVHVDDELGGTSTFTPPSGWTERFDSSAVYGGERHSVGVFEIVRATAGAQTGTVTHSRSMRSTVYAIALDGILSTQTVTSPSIPTAESFGAGSVTTGPVSATSGSIPSAESFGLGRVDQNVSQAAGIPTAESVPPSTIVVSGAISSDSIPSAESFGAGSVVAGPVAVTSGSIPTAESVPATSALRLNISSPSIPSAAQVPGGAVTVGVAIVTGGSIPSAETFGAGVVAAGPVSVTSTSIPSAEAFGPHRVSMTLYSPSIPSAESVQGGALVVSAVFIYSPSIPSGESFGFSEVNITLDPATRIGQRKPRTSALYEVLVVHRISQPSGPPVLEDVDAIEWSSLQWSSTLSRAQSLSVTFERARLTAAVRLHLRSPDRLATELWLLRNGAIVQAGPLLGGASQGESLRLEVGGLMTYLDLMLVEQNMRFDQIEQFAIAAGLIDQWQNNVAPGASHGHFGIDTSKVGASGRLRDQTYDRNEIHWVGKRIEELGARRDGFDAEIDPSSRALQLWYPGKGVDRSSGEDTIVFDRRNVDDGSGMFSLGPGDLASDAYGSGSAAGADTTLWSQQANLDLRAAYGRSAVAGSWSDVSEQATLDDHVAALRDARNEPLRAPGRKVRVTPDSDLASYDVGDTVLYEIDELLGIGGAYRIRSRSVGVAGPKAEETVDLEFV